MHRTGFWRGHQRLWIATFLLFALVCGSTIAIALWAKPRYTSTSIIGAQPTATAVSSQLLEFQMPSLEVRAVGPRLEKNVREQLFSPLGSIAWNVTTHVTPGSGVMDITIESADSRIPTTVAGAYAKALAQADLTDYSMDVRVISPATEAKQTATKRVILVTGIGLALLIPALVALWVALREAPRRPDRRSATEYEIRLN